MPTQLNVTQEYSQYSSCQGTQAIPAIVSMLTAPNAAPLNVLSGLLYTPNQTAVIQELLTAVGNQHDRDLREAAGRFTVAVRIHLEGISISLS